jgi:hypothetical protein
LSNCTEYKFSYSFGDVSLKDLRDAGRQLTSAILDTTFNTTLCLDDKVLHAFKKDYVLTGESYSESVVLQSFEETNVDIPPLPAKNSTNLESLYLAWSYFAEQLTKATDPQLRSLALENKYPTICLKANDSDSCLEIYADSTNSNISCGLIKNETRKSNCFAAFQGTQ